MPGFKDVVLQMTHELEVYTTYGKHSTFIIKNKNLCSSQFQTIAWP